MKKALFIAYCAAAMLPVRAFAYIMVGNHRLDHVIYAGHDPKLIVAGQIAEKDVKELPDGDYGYPAEIGFKFKVASVILGAEDYKWKTLVIPATSFSWPDGLLAFEKGTPCVLVLRTDWGEKRDGLSLESVVPVENIHFHAAKDGEEAKRILATELLQELKRETSTNRQRNLILQVGPILQRGESDALLPFLKSDDIWLRRAAIAGLVSATKEPKYIAMAAEDIGQFVKATDLKHTITSPDGTPGFAPYPILFTHYFFLEFWSEEDVAAAPAYLPIFRLLAHTKELPYFERWQHGVEPLCQLGTREDAKFLYEYLEDRKGENKAILQTASNRQRLLMGLSRIFNLGLLNWGEPDFLKKEEEQHDQVSDALVKEGIIAKEARN